MKLIYMDYAATTPMDEEVIGAMAEVMRSHYGNPSSLHRIGVEAEGLVKRSRQTIAEAVGVQPEEIRFTSGGTESNNLAILGAARRYRSRGNHLITTKIEHASVYEAFRLLESEGFRVTYLGVDGTGAVRMEELEEALTEETILVSVMAVNNEMGRIQPIAEIGKLLGKRPRTLFHVDAVQALGRLPLHPKELGIDLFSCAAHKLHGPKGAGFLYCREGVELQPLLAGGGQEEGLRPGTENVPALVGMAKAVRVAVQRQAEFASHTRRLRLKLLECIDSAPALRYNGSRGSGEMAPHILHFSYPGMKSEVLVYALEQQGVCVSARSACSSGTERPSRVLEAMGASYAVSVSGVRLSFSLRESEEDIERVCRALRQVVQELGSMAAEPQKGRRS
ncbi:MULTISPECIES: cysteine desulfurase family protein [Paenibacillus]|uniref:cysteine desulfurase family protein n=1 Tax=Paenibacillus TaxID=44249 RepID=UPI0022B919EE|nr:cysteine desulfurase family protein [Paenibacillus caseinilyticus]MCZ8518740.1 cysteine desulfurase family protein [Paenibacillus caseinilyticus]